MDISKEDAKRLAGLGEALVDRLKTAKKLPVSDSGSCVLDGLRITVTLSVSEPEMIESLKTE